MSLWAELRRRNVVRVGLAYTLVAWIVLQVVDFALDVIDAPNWILQLLVLLAALGLPAVALFAWVFEMTPEGLKLEREVDRSQSITPETGKKLNLVIIGTLALAVVLLSYRQFVAPPALESPTATPDAQVAAADDAEQPPGARSIAVLPFDDYSEAQDQDYFSKGIAEEVLNLLAQTDALRVAARTSSFALAGGSEDIRDIGRKLDVDTVLEGSIRKAGPKIRITAQLINVDDGYHLWSESYDRDYEDIFQIQDEIAAAIMDSLRVHLLEEEQARIQSQVAHDVDAYSAYLIGRERMALRTRDDLEAARVQFEKAIELDPEYAPARVSLAHAWLLSEQEQYGRKDIDRDEVDQAITPHLEKALELAPDNPEAIAVQGYHHLRRFRYPEAGAAFDRALELNPNYAEAYAWRAEIAYEDHRYLDMLADKEKAYALDPMSLQLSADLAAEYRNFWRPQDAERIIQRMFDLHPDHPLAYQAAIANLSNHGRYGEAMLTMQKAIETNPDNEGFLRWEGWLYLLLGMTDEAAEHGSDQSRFIAALVREDFDTANEMLREALADEDVEDVEDDWYGLARWLYSVERGESSVQQLNRYVQLDLQRMADEGFPWQERCLPYLIHDLRTVGQPDSADPMMDSCREGIEKRFEARYLCPCSLNYVVLFTILDGRMDEAVERADFWLSNGDSDFSLHLDPIFAELSERPEYDELLARNAAQIQRQRAIFLAGADVVHDTAHP